jgi:PAS domain S-box-containing protein
MLLQLQEELNRTSFQLFAVNQAMKMVGSVTQLQRTLDLTADMFVEMTRALTGCVVLVDDGTTLTVRAAKGDGADSLLKQRFKLSQAALRWFREQRGPVVLGDGSSLPEHVRDGLAAAPRAFAVWVPLATVNRLVGLVALSDKFGGIPYTPDELAVLETLAAQTAIAIENARLVTRLKGKVQLANRELQETNRQLSLEMAKLRATVEGMADGLLVTDPRGRVSFLNPAVRDFLGWKESAVEGEPFRKHAPNETLVEMVDQVTTGTEEHAEKEITVTEPLRRVYTARSTALRDDKGKAQGAVTTLSDITTLKELADMKADFVAFIVHELRTPLTSIKGFVNTLQESPPDSFAPEDVAEFHGIMDGECTRLLGMINELLDVSRLEAGRPLPIAYSEVDLSPLIANVVKLQEHYASGRHTLVTEMPAAVPTIDADRDRVIQILTNLLSNAIKYSPAGGTVTTKLEVAGDSVTLSVADQGLGMQPEDMARLFQPYQRVLTEDTARIRGTGLGLYLTKQLVELQAGRIWAESEYGKGSTFLFTLPMRRPEPQVAGG